MRDDDAGRTKREAARDDAERTGGRGDGADRSADTSHGGDRTADARHAADGVDDAASLAADARAERLDRVAVLYAQITAATREFLAAVAECDRHRDWAAEGFGSCAEWLAWRVGLRANAARERVRVARVLEHLPRTSEAMARGEVSYSKVRALTRIATAESEGELLELARSGSTAYLERVVRAYKRLGREDEAKRERVLQGLRRFSVVPDEDGMYVVRGRLMPEVAAVLMRAVDAASDALYAGSSEAEREQTEPAQRRADAVGLLAERALAAGFGRGGPAAAEGEPEAEGPTAAEGEIRAEGADEAPVSGSRAERYQVLLHVERETLAESGEPGMSELEDGTRVSAETARRIACDASIVEVVHGDAPNGPVPGPHAGRASAERRADADEEQRDTLRSPVGPRTGSPAPAPAAHGEEARSPTGSAPARTRRPVLDLGRRTRSVPPALRRALEARDRGCRFPGCGRRFTDAHHIRHWADGGETRLGNLVLLCRRHHRRVHEDGWTVCSDVAGARIVFFRPDGSALAAAPPMIPPTPEPRPTRPAQPTRERQSTTPSQPSPERQPAPEPRPTRPARPGPAPTLDPTAPDPRPAANAARGASLDRRLFEQLLRDLAERGIEPDWRTNRPRHRHDSAIPWLVEAAAREALERSDDPAHDAA